MRIITENATLRIAREVQTRLDKQVGPPVDVNDLNIVLFYFGTACGGETAQMLRDMVNPAPFPRFLEELGFDDIDAYVQYVQGLNEIDRALHAAELLTSYLLWGE